VRGGKRRWPFAGWRVADEAPDKLNLIASNRPGPDAIAMTEDILRRLFGLLDQQQVLILKLRLANHSVPSIVDVTGIPKRTIQRRLKEIRRIWDEADLLDPRTPG